MDEIQQSDVHKNIDCGVVMMPDLLRLVRSADIKKRLSITRERDFVLGAAWGMVLMSKSCDFGNSVEAKTLLPETAELFLKRSKEIEDAIMLQGP